MKSRFRRLLTPTLVAVALLAPQLHAEDIDLYVGGDQANGAVANVLIVLDNSSNWAAANQNWPDGAKQGVSELETLSEVIGTLSDNINVGLMTFAQSGSSFGGQVRYHIRAMDSTNRGRFQQIANHMAINAVGANDPDEVASSTNYDNLMNSAFRYFNGLTRWQDVNAGQDRRDYTDNTATGVFDPNPNPASYTWGYNTSTQTNYNKPADAGAGCAKNYIIFIGNGFPQNIGSASEITDAANLLTADQKSGTTGWTLTPDLTPVTSISPKNPWADEWARFMYTYGVPSAVTNPKYTAGAAGQSKYIWNKISTYTVDVCKDGCEAPQAALLKSMAKVGGGKYFKSTSKAEIKTALALIFAEIQAVNSVFASATLPISVNTQGTYENQVYIGVFRPDANSRPRWYGNLKEYKFGRYCDIDGNDKVLIDTTRATPLTGTYSESDERVADDVAAPDCGTDASGAKRPTKLYLADKVGYRAIDEEGNTGFIDLSAQSYWTTASNFWDFYKVDPAGASDGPDGPNVERGGAAQRLRTKWAGTPPTAHPDGRKVLTCIGCVGGDAMTNHPVTAGNSSVTAALAVPAGSATISLQRYGNWILAQTANGSAHGFDGGTTINISGATPANYNISCSPSELSVWDTGFWCYKLGFEKPAADTWIDGKISAVASSISITQLTVVATASSSTGYLATATAANGLSAGNSVVVSGSGTQSWLTGTRSVKTASATQFTYEVTPTIAPATAFGTSKAGTASALSNKSVVFDAASKKVVVLVDTTGTLGAEYNAGNLVTVAGATPSTYNGIWTSAGTSTDCPGVSSVQGNRGKYYCFSIVRSPDPGTGIMASPLGATEDVLLYRPGSYNQFYVVKGSAGFVGYCNSSFSPSFDVGRTFAISGASDSDYNGTYTTQATYDWCSGAGSRDWLWAGNIAFSPAQPTGTAVASINATSGPSATKLIEWLRGKDLWEDENQNASLADVRAGIHGDVLHARPVVVNYGGSIGIVGYYGSNDGFIRAIQGGLADTDGAEKWAYIPQEFLKYPTLSRLYSNSPVIRYPNQACGITPAPMSRNYHWDGPIAAYQSLESVYYTSDPAVTSATEPFVGCATASPATCFKRSAKTYIFASMRRGGRSVYAMDVSAPDAPKFMWRKGCRLQNGACDEGFAEMGQTWSEPKVIKLRGIRELDGTAQNVLAVAFGAGYDAAQEDKAPGSARLPTMGRGVFVLNAETGARISLLQDPVGPVRYSVAADINVLDIDADGYIDRIYAVDTGGNILRFDADQTKEIGTAAYWKSYRIASLGDVANDGGADARKFLFQPEVLPFRYDGGALKVNIMVGSGDREKPLPSLSSATTTNVLNCPANYSDTYYAAAESRVVTDRFYAVIDTVQAGDDPITVNASPIVEANLQEVNADPNVLTPFALGTAYKGWYVTLKNNPSNYARATAEEKVVNAARLIGGVVFFATSTPAAPNPAAGVCSNLGEALGYAVDPFTGLPAINRDGSATSDGTATFTSVDYATRFAGGGLPPTVTAGVVTIGGTPYRFIIGSGGTGVESASSIAGQRNILTLKGVRTRLYWSYGAD